MQSPVLISLCVARSMRPRISSSQCKFFCRFRRTSFQGKSCQGEVMLHDSTDLEPRPRLRSSLRGRKTDRSAGFRSQAIEVGCHRMRSNTDQRGTLTSVHESKRQRQLPCVMCLYSGPVGQDGRDVWRGTRNISWPCSAFGVVADVLRWEYSPLRSSTFSYPF